MKIKILLLMFLSLYISGHTQERNDTFRISLGVNAIDNTGDRSLFDNATDWAFDQPISLGVEYKLNRVFGVEALFSLNEFSSNTVRDGVKLGNDTDYISVDASLKYYIGKYFLNSEKIDIFLNGGFGLYHFVASNSTANLGGGILYWFMDDLGVRIQSMGKFNLGSEESSFDSNHIQYFLQLVYRF
jgi:hypothetical protein